MVASPLRIETVTSQFIGSVSHAESSLVHLEVGGLFSKKLSDYWGWVGGLEAMFVGDHH